MNSLLVVLIARLIFDIDIVISTACKISIWRVAVHQSENTQS